MTRLLDNALAGLAPSEARRAVREPVVVHPGDRVLVECSGSGTQFAIVLAVRADRRVRLTKFRRQSKRWTQPALYPATEVIEVLRPPLAPWQRDAVSILLEEQSRREGT